MLIPQHLTTDQLPVVAFMPVLDDHGNELAGEYAAVVRRDNVTDFPYLSVLVHADPDAADGLREIKREPGLSLPEALDEMNRMANLR